MEVGYNSLGTFSKTFSELVGLSPQEFRAMPKRLTAKQFATAIWRYLAARKKISGPTIEGVIEGPGRPKGFTFVGTFTKGVPLGVPISGTVMILHRTPRAAGISSAGGADAAFGQLDRNGGESSHQPRRQPACAK
jgi:hypothetical protein